MSFSSSSTSTSEALLADAAETLQHQLVYNGEVLDIALESLKNYKEGTQSLDYLEKSVGLGYALFRMLEKWGKTRTGDEVYVRRKKVRRKRKTKGGFLL
jgi:replication fork protection complex subunit Tof1/Swi1